MAEKNKLKFFSLEDFSGTFSGDDSRHCTLTTKLRNFSSCSDLVHSEYECDEDDLVHCEYECDDEEFELYFKAFFYPNGSSQKNVGFVSVVISAGGGACHYALHFTLVSFACLITVVDASGERRYPQSFAFDSDLQFTNDEGKGVPAFGLDKYMKRSTLLSSSSEFLPGDTLTLCLEIDYKVQNNRLNFSNYHISKTTVKIGNKNYILADAIFERDLLQMSPVFKDMMEFTKAEPIPIPSQEITSFELACLVVKGGELKIKSVDEICDLYIIADKYDVVPEQILPTCRQLLITIMGAITTPEMVELVNESLPKMSELADRYTDDDGLEEILAMFSRIKNNFESGEESDIGMLATEWKCEYKKDLIHGPYFMLRKNEDRSEECIRMDFLK